MTYIGWEPRHRCTTVAPGKLDLFVLTLVDGARVALDPITDYDAALARARSFHRGRPCQIKVLPVTGPELRNLLAVGLPDRPPPMDVADLRLIRDTLLTVARDGCDPQARGDAIDLLITLRVVTP